MFAVAKTNIHSMHHFVCFSQKNITTSACKVTLAFVCKVTISSVCKVTLASVCKVPLSSEFKVTVSSVCKVTIKSSIKKDKKNNNNRELIECFQRFKALIKHSNNSDFVATLSRLLRNKHVTRTFAKTKQKV